MDTSHLDGSPPTAGKNDCRAWTGRIALLVVAFVVLSGSVVILKNLDMASTAPARFMVLQSPCDSAAGPRQQQPLGKTAFMITITKEMPFLDGAGVLKASIEKQMNASDADIEFVAIVHVNISSATTDGLEALGYRVERRELGVKLEEVRNPVYRQMLPKSGCCGESEFLKLEAFTFTEFRRVVHIDVDYLMRQWIPEVLSSDAFMFTVDYGMHTSSMQAGPMQGGFFALQPSLDVYKELMEIVREGDFRAGTGWGGTGIGWCYGGQTVQGLIPFYYVVKRADLQSQPLDTCVYNHMSAGGVCNPVQLMSIKGKHFTDCIKPWVCDSLGTQAPNCEALKQEWIQMLRELAGPEASPGCIGGEYHAWLPVSS